MNTDFSPRPKDYRKLMIKPGTRIGLYGDLESPSIWSHEKILVVSDWKYIVVKRQFGFGQGVGWDAGVLVTFKKAFETIGFSGNKSKFRNLILVHRYSDLVKEDLSVDEKFSPPWQDDATLVIYGIKIGDELLGDVFSLQDLEPRSDQFSLAATITLIDQPSEYISLLISRGRQLLEHE